MSRLHLSVLLPTLALLAVVVAAAGCGGSSSGAKQSSVSPAQSTTSSEDPAEANVPSVLYDYEGTAGCLDQYSGNGAGRGSGNGAQTISIEVPDSADEDHYSGAYLYFYPSADGAARHEHDKGFRSDDTLVTGNVIISGYAVTKPYAKQALLNCLQIQNG